MRGTPGGGEIRAAHMKDVLERLPNFRLCDLAKSLPHNGRPANAVPAFAATTTVVAAWTRHRPIIAGRDGFTEGLILERLHRRSYDRPGLDADGHRGTAFEWKGELMGHLTTLTGLDKSELLRYVITPMWGDGLREEARDFWEGQARIFRVKASELSEDITQPQKTILYVLAHSGRGVTKIADNEGEMMTAGELVEYLIDNGLPPRILAVKIWACFTGINGFAQEVKAKFLEANKGYNPVVVGYNEVTGGPSDTLGSPHKHVFQENGNQRGPLIGRASQHRTIF